MLRFAFQDLEVLLQCEIIATLLLMALGALVEALERVLLVVPEVDRALQEICIRIVGVGELVADIHAELAPLHRLDPLPISRRLIFAGLIVPLTLVLVASYGAGAFVAAWFGAPTEYVNFVKDAKSGRFSVSVPLRVHEVAWDGRVPEVTSPWGESHPAERLSLFRGSRAVLWNPFSAPEGSSPRFTALQISRAVQAVYGA